MDWQQAYSVLSDREKEDFARILSQLFEQTFLLRDTWDLREQRLVTNRDYWFVERVFPVFDAYLRVSGFELQKDNQHGVMGLYNRFGRNRARLDKYTTYLLYALRIVYDEQMEQVAMRKEVIVTLRTSLTKLNTLGLLDRRLTAGNLFPALKQLRRRRVLDPVEENWQDPDSRWMIYPTITLLITDAHINALYDQYMDGTLRGADGAAELDGLNGANGSTELDEWGDTEEDRNNVDETEVEETTGETSNGVDEIRENEVFNDDDGATRVQVNSSGRVTVIAETSHSSHRADGKKVRR